MASKAQARASNKYDKVHTKSVMLKFNLTSDADILSKLDEVNNKQGYIKELVRSDIRGSGNRMTIESIKTLLLPIAKRYNLRGIYLFGSYARGEATAESDLDFVIDGGDYGNMSDYLKMLNEFEVRLGKSVDVISCTKVYNDNTRAGKRLRQNIERDKVLIYENNK